MASAFVSLFPFFIKNNSPNLNSLYAHAFSFVGRGLTVFPGQTLLSALVIPSTTGIP